MAHGSRLTRWDAIVFLRSAAVAGLALALAWVITAVTDEGGISWGARAGRTIPLAPICAAVGTWGALAPVRASGEVRALEALGRSLGQIAASAVAGGAALAICAGVAVGSLNAIDAAGFYPTTLRESSWAWQGDTFMNHARGLRIERDGTPVRFAQPAEGRALAAIPRGGRAAAAAATAMAGVALPLLLAQLLLSRPALSHPMLSRPMLPRAILSRPTLSRAIGSPDSERVPASDGLTGALWPPTLAAAIALLASAMLFQAAAARLMPAPFAALPPALLLGFAFARVRTRDE